MSTTTAPSAAPPPPDEDPRRSLGRRGEDIACAHLESRGWEILDRNRFASFGEIDIVAHHSETGVLALVEVRTRSSLRAGHPLESITARKLAVLRRLLSWWLAQADAWYPEIRIDVIGIVESRDGSHELTHLEGAGPL